MCELKLHSDTNKRININNILLSKQKEMQKITFNMTIFFIKFNTIKLLLDLRISMTKQYKKCIPHINIYVHI